MKRIWGWLVCASLLLAGCSTAPGPIERKKLQGRIFDKVSYEMVFRASLTVLQTEGYIVKHKDQGEGLIVANIQKSERTGAFWSVLGDRHTTNEEVFEFTVNLYRLKDGKIMTRVSLQQTQPSSLGGHTGEELVDPKGYVLFYERLKDEVYKAVKNAKKPDPRVK